MADDTNQGNSGAGQQAAGRKPPAVLTVGHFRHRDPLLGFEHDELGVVVKAGEVLTVRPLREHYLQVDPAEFTPLTADDLG